MRLMFGILFCAMTACASFPELDAINATVDEDAPYPRLAPLAPLLAQAEAATQTRITPASVASLDARIAQLRRIADGLRGPVIDAATLARMRAAGRRAALR